MNGNRNHLLVDSRRKNRVHRSSVLGRCLEPCWWSVLPCWWSVLMSPPPHSTPFRALRGSQQVQPVKARVGEWADLMREKEGEMCVCVCACVRICILPQRRWMHHTGPRCRSRDQTGATLILAQYRSGRLREPAREPQNMREEGRGEQERERENVCVCVCVCVSE